MKNYLVFENGEKIDIDTINEKFPFSMLESDENVLKIAELIVEKIYLIPKETLEYKISVNFLAQRSIKVKNIAAIILLSKTFKVTDLYVEYMNQLFTVFFEYPLNIKDYKLKKNYLDKSLFFASFVKYFPNKLFLLTYLLFFRNSKLKKSVIRAWVDVDEKLHETVIKDSTIFIYPFGINLLRSFKFIKHCFSNYDSVTLMGVPYSFVSFIKIYLKLLRKSDIGIIDYEMDAMKRHAVHFNRFEKIFTSDEFIPAIYVLYYFIDPQITVINNCHGIGVYNRFINYSQMIVFNNAQKNYYELKNPQINYEIKVNDEEYRHALGKHNITYIYLDQGDLRTYNLLYEYKMQEKIMNKLNELSQLDKAVVYIKFHPNRSDKSMKNLFNQYKNIQPFSNIEYFNDRKIIYINLFSTAYYDFRKFGQVIFVKDDLFNPQKVFGKNILTMDIKNLEETLVDNQ